MASGSSENRTEAHPRYPLKERDWDMRFKDAQDAQRVKDETLRSLGIATGDTGVLTSTELLDIETLAVASVDLDRLNALRLKGKAVDPALHDTAQNSYRRAREAVRLLEKRIRKRRAASRG